MTVAGSVADTPEITLLAIAISRTAKLQNTLKKATLTHIVNPKWLIDVAIVELDGIREVLESARKVS